MEEMTNLEQSVPENNGEESFEALIRGRYKVEFDQKVQKILEGRLKALHRENAALRARGEAREAAMTLQQQEMAAACVGFDALLRRAVRYGASRAGQDIARSLSGGRVAENGGGGHAAAVSHVDPARLTQAERADIRRRVARGEKVKFS